MSSLLHQLDAWAREDGTAVAQEYRDASGAWKQISAEEYKNRILWLALFLESRGMTRNDIGTILSYNCPAWVHFEFACVLLGGASAGIYPNSTSHDMQYVLKDTKSRFLGIQGKGMFEKLLEEGALPDDIAVIISFDGSVVHPKAISYEDALAEGRQLAERHTLVPEAAPTYERYLEKVDVRGAAFIIYTSGTTGVPKGAILSLDNLTYTVEQVAKRWKLSRGGMRLFSFLPLCHIAEKLQNLGGGIVLRYSVSFCSKFENLTTELLMVRPTILLCVPRVWEKMMEKVELRIRKIDAPIQKALMNWAFRIGREMGEAQYRFPKPLLWAQWKIAERLVIMPIRRAMGLDQAVLVASGAAVLPNHVKLWFRSIGIEINEAYGQTESTGVITATTPRTDTLGVVGKALPGTELMLTAEGEIRSRGRNIFLGYLNDEAHTREVLVEQGWLATGDLGVIDDLGCLAIRGRKKEIMKTSGGKMIAPVPIEERLKASILIGQVCLVGDGRKFLSALITLSEETLASVEPQGLVIEDVKIVREIQKELQKLNATLASFEQIKRFTILAQDFSLEKGEMTPTLKMKRNIIEKHYKDIIERMYSSNSAAA